METESRGVASGLREGKRALAESWAEIPSEMMKVLELDRGDGGSHCGCAHCR